MATLVKCDMCGKIETESTSHIINCNMGDNEIDLCKPCLTKLLSIVKENPTSEKADNRISENCARVTCGFNNEIVMPDTEAGIQIDYRYVIADLVDHIMDYLNNNMEKSNREYYDIYDEIKKIVKRETGD